MMRVLNRVGPVLMRGKPSLNQQTLLGAAQRASKSKHFGDEGFREALPVLLDSIDREANLNWLGRVILYQEIVGFLGNRFSVYRYRAEHPEVADGAVNKPLFIVGLPRTGTTVLFNLLGQDPANRVPLGWEVQFPDPPPEAATYATDPRIEKAKTFFGHMDKMAPSLATIHEVGADLPQECLPVLAQSMLGPQFQVSFNVPSYQAWVDEQSHAPAYRYHRHFLQHLQSRCMKQRWVLKSPAHLFSLDALLQEYPDARILFTHRDPAKTMPSLASLIYVIRGLASDGIDPHHLGRQQMTSWGAALDRATEARARHSDKAAQFLDLQFEDIVADPVAALQGAYEHFDMPWSGEVESRMRAFLADNPRGKHGAHQYELADFGLELGAIRERFADYCNAYGVKLVA